MEMNDRKRNILMAIVNDYVSCAEPVGSRTIAKKYDLGISPATIRNEMSDLEEMGYIMQPYTSAGRIPSYQGYRYFVDFLMQVDGVDQPERKIIESDFQEKLFALDDIIDHSCKLLSKLTDYTTMVVVPKRSNGRLESIQLLLLSTQRVLVIVITDNGYIGHKILDLDESLELSKMQQINFYMQNKLYGLSLEKMSFSLLKEIAFNLEAKSELLTKVLNIMEEALQESSEERVFLGGVMNLLNQPEFKDVERIKSLLEVLEKTDVIKSILLNAENEKFKVMIGDEIQCEGIDDCSVVVKKFMVNKQEVGTVGLLGPSRMNYSRSVALLDATTDKLSSFLAKALIIK